MDIITKGNIFIGVYFVAWIILLINYQKKRKIFDGGSFIISLYSIYALSSILLYNDPNSSYYNTELSFFPLLYLFILFLITFFPILNFNSLQVNSISPPSKKLINTISWFMIICSLLSIFNIFDNLLNGLIIILSDSTGGQELYRETLSNANSLGDGISNLPSIFANALYNFSVLLLFYYCTLKMTKNNKIIIIGLIISCIIGMITYISTGQRGGLVKRLLIIIATYYLLRHYIHQQINNKIKIFGVVFIIIISIPFMALTISRFGYRDGGTSSSIYNYAGQANINFDQYAFDNNGIRYGDRTFPIFKQMLAFENVPKNFMERRSKYPDLKINDEVFISYIGDFVLDFGPIIAALILILFSYIMLKSTKPRNGVILFHELILLQFVLSISVQGGSLFPYADTGNLIIITYFLLYITFRSNYSLYKPSK